MEKEPQLLPLPDNVFFLAEEICEDISQGNISYEDLQEIKAQQKEMFPLMLSMEQKMLRDLNAVKPGSSSLFDIYAAKMTKFAIRKSIRDVQGQLIHFETKYLAIREIEGDEMYYIWYSPDGKPELCIEPGECSEMLEGALDYQRFAKFGNPDESTPDESVV